MGSVINYVGRRGEGAPAVRCGRTGLSLCRLPERARLRRSLDGGNHARNFLCRVRPEISSKAHPFLLKPQGVYPQVAVHPLAGVKGTPARLASVKEVILNFIHFLLPLFYNVQPVFLMI